MFEISRVFVPGLLLWPNDRLAHVFSGIGPFTCERMATMAVSM